MIMIMMITPWTAWPTCSASSWDWRWPPWPCWVSWPAPRWGAPSPGPSPAGPGAADTLGRRGCCPPWRCSSGRPSPTRRCSGTTHWQSRYLLPAGQKSEVRGQRLEVRGQRSEVSVCPLPQYSLSWSDCSIWTGRSISLFETQTDCLSDQKHQLNHLRPSGWSS